MMGMAAWTDQMALTTLVPHSHTPYTTCVPVRLCSPSIPPPTSIKQAVLRDETGAPILPARVQASISHKDDLAVCLLRNGDSGGDWMLTTYRPIGSNRMLVGEGAVPWLFCVHSRA
jgi:hypothetical protein